jgi:cell division protein FtsN
MISSTSHDRVSRRRGAARWLPAVLALVALGVVCGLLGAYVLAPVLAPGAPSADASQSAAGGIGEPPRADAPVVSYPSGQNQVRIVEKSIRQAPPTVPVEPEHAITTSLEPAGSDPALTDASAVPATRLRRKDGRKPATPGDNPQARTDSEPGAGAATRTTPTAGETTTGDTGIVIEPAAPAEPSRPTAPSSATPAERPFADGGSLYRVQVGRFADESDARALADELKRDGLAPTVVRTGPEGRGLYRVQVGTFRQRENADKALETLRRKQLEPYLAEDEP